MKTITLQKLSLTDFKGNTIVIIPNGEDISIYGDNGTGKTTIADAFAWLLFDKDSLGRSNFEIKNLDSDGTTSHGLEHTVEAILQADDTITTLKKVYHEVWSKKRGSAERTLTGNTKDHFINGVPVKENEYKDYISDLTGDESIFRLLTSPSMFPALAWDKQRSILLEACGDVTDAQVIATDEALSPLTELLTRYTVSKNPIDDLKKVVMSRRTEINKELDRLPVRIDEVNRSLPDITGLDINAIDTAINQIETQINDAKLRLQGVDTGGEIAGMSKELAAIEVEISRLENAHYASHMMKARETMQMITRLQDLSEAEQSRARNINTTINGRQREIDSIEVKLSMLREKWSAIDEEIYLDTTEDTCPLCDQALPSDRVEEARTKALAAFNRSKAERLTDIETEGKRLATTRDEYQKEIDDLRLKIPDIIDRQADIERLTADYDNETSMATDYILIPERAELMNKKAVAEHAIADARAGVAPEKERIEEEIAIFEAAKKDLTANRGKFSSRQQGEKRIEELKQQEKKYALEFEELEKQLFLIETFTKRKVSMLDEKINARFQTVRFKLFRQYISGGIEDCCEITVNGVPYNGGLNNAARMQAGCEIISVLQAHYGIAPTVFIDNRESVTKIPPMNCQVINLYVSPGDKVLRVVTEGSKSRVAA